jgi:hypothetical protein
VTLERLTGTYLLGVEPLIVAEQDGDLVLSALGVPPEFAARIVENGGGFRVEGGPLQMERCSPCEAPRGSSSRSRDRSRSATSPSTDANRQARGRGDLRKSLVAWNVRPPSRPVEKPPRA